MSLTNLLFIVAFSLSANQREMTVTYYTPRSGTVYVDVWCAGDPWWQSGAANQPVSGARTNSITIRNLCGQWGMVRLRMGN